MPFQSSIIFTGSSLEESDDEDALVIDGLTNEDDSTPNSCSHCGETFPSLNELIIHVRNAHLIESPHICQICKLEFKFAARLKEHMRTHSGKKPYECEVRIRVIN